MTDTTVRNYTLIDTDLLDSEQFISRDEVLRICMHLGQVLKGVNHKDRDAAIFRLHNEFRNLGNEGVPLAAMMFGHVAKGWKQPK